MNFDFTDDQISAVINIIIEHDIDREGSTVDRNQVLRSNPIDSD